MHKGDATLNTSRELAAEFFGTLWLVLGGCGSAIFAAQFLTGDGAWDLGIGLLGVSLAFGLTVVTGAYAFGHISGGHFNPVVTLGLVAGGKFSPAKVLPYIVAQVLGAIAAGFLIYLIVSGRAGWDGIAEGAGTFATNGFGENGSPGGFSALSVFIAEAVLTALFLMVILGATAKRAAAGMGGMAIGLMLTLIHLVSIPISNTSVNPARSTSQAIVAAVEGVSLPVEQLWMFWVAPIVGAVIGGMLYRALLDTDDVV